MLVGVIFVASREGRLDRTMAQLDLGGTWPFFRFGTLDPLHQGKKSL
jgi:hypothetical protein